MELWPRTEPGSFAFAGFVHRRMRLRRSRCEISEGRRLGRPLVCRRGARQMSRLRNIRHASRLTVLGGSRRVPANQSDDGQYHERSHEHRMRRFVVHTHCDERISVNARLARICSATPSGPAGRAMAISRAVHGPCRHRRPGSVRSAGYCGGVGVDGSGAPAGGSCETPSEALLTSTNTATRRFFAPPRSSAS